MSLGPDSAVVEPQFSESEVSSSEETDPYVRSIFSPQVFSKLSLSLNQTISNSAENSPKPQIKGIGYHNRSVGVGVGHIVTHVFTNLNLGRVTRRRTEREL